MKKKLLAMGLIATLVFTMTACGDSKAKSNDEKTELSVIDSEWYGLDVFQLDSTSGSQGLNSSSLFQWNPETNTMDDNVCTDWVVSEDGHTVTFNVPEGLKYSTGETVEPEDVVASIEHGLDVSPYSDGYNNIEAMDVKDRQVTLHLSEFRSDMQYYFCAGFISIIDKDELDSMSDEELMWGCHPYGMYALAENGYVSGSEVKLVRNDEYKCSNPLVENKGPGHFETVNVRFNVEKFTQTEELKSGHVDLLTSISSEQKKELENEENVTIKETTYPNTAYFEVNTNTGVLSDYNVRKALALSIDRDKLAEVVDGTIKPAYGMISDSMQNYSQDALDYFEKNFSNNPEEAKKILKEAGWKDTNGDGILEKKGKKLSFTMYAWTNSTTIPEALAEQLRQVGFEMQIEAIDWNYIHERIGSNEYDTGIEHLAWAEPMLILNICYYDKDAPGNTEEYKNLVRKAASTVDPEERTELIRQAQMNIFENLDIIPFYSSLDYSAHNKELKGFNVLGDGTTPLNDLAY